MTCMDGPRAFVRKRPRSRHPKAAAAVVGLDLRRQQSELAVDAPCFANHTNTATTMSSVRGGRGGISRGRSASPFGAPAAPKTTRPSFAPRARASNQVRFNAPSRGTGERGGRGTFRAGHGQRGGARGREKATPPPTRSPFAAPTQAQPSNASSSFPDRFQAVRFLPHFHG